MDDARVPLITSTFISLAVLTSLSVQCGWVTPYQLFYSSDSVFKRGQTAFLWFGPLQIDMVFHLFFLRVRRSLTAHARSVRYSKMLESSRRPADFLWLLIVACAILLILSPLSPAPFLSSPLSFTLVYLWSRLNPNVRLSLFGVVTITAPYLPYALVVFSWALNSSLAAVVGDLLGIATGHFIYFFNFIWNQERASGGRNWLETPPILFVED